MQILWDGIKSTYVQKHEPQWKKHKRLNQRLLSKSVQELIAEKRVWEQRTSIRSPPGFVHEEAESVAGLGDLPSRVPVHKCPLRGPVLCRSSGGAERSWEEEAPAGDWGDSTPSTTSELQRACQVTCTAAITLPVTAFNLKGALEKKSHNYW